GGEERRLLLDASERAVVAADDVESAREVLVLASDRSVERDGVVGLGDLKAVEHLLLTHLEVEREFVHPRAPSGAAAYLLLGLVDLSRALLGAAVDVEGPRAIAEVALELADDRRHRERGEGEAPIGIEALDRLDEPQARDLEEIVVRFARGHVP